MENDCIFCKIVKGKIPSHKIYENKKIYAFLDINPVAKAHTLIIPKKHYENIFDCNEKFLKEIIKEAQKIALHYKKVLGCTGINILQSSGKSAEQEIFHIHFHIIPRFDDDDFKMLNAKKYQEDDLKKLADKLKIDYD